MLCLQWKVSAMRKCGLVRMPGIDPDVKIFRNRYPHTEVIEIRLIDLVVGGVARSRERNLIFRVI